MSEFLATCTGDPTGLYMAIATVAISLAALVLSLIGLALR